jgi:hypothetical protein
MTVLETCRTVSDAFPNPANATRLLLGTCAQESLFVHRRQISFNTQDLRFCMEGGFGLWQVEPDTAQWVIGKARANGLVLQRCYKVLDCAEHSRHIFSTAISTGQVSCLLASTLLRKHDILSALLARLVYYYKTPRPIPETVEGHADYWKRWYNTIAGKGTTAQYMRNWLVLCKPLIGE